MGKMNDMKYVVFANPVGEETIAVFPSAVMHIEMSKLVTDNAKRLKPISGGFIDSEGRCYGQSLSLELKAREQEDTSLLNDLVFPDRTYDAIA